MNAGCRIGGWLASLACLLAAPAAAQAPGGDETRNWFDDPFLQISSAIPDCPVPAGPFITKAERLAESHRRAEKGTTCWLAGQCDRPNAFAYDRDIAANIRAALARSHPFPDTTLWIRVQGRVVFVEGCVRGNDVAARLEAFARSQRFVEQAFANVRTCPGGRPPYRVRQAAAGCGAEPC
jgi:hypothetical protein